MSVENILEYVRRCTTEPELREVAKSIGLVDVEKHMRHAESLGLDFSQADLEAFRRQAVDADGELGDLTEEELERVAGGIAAVTVAGAVGVGAAIGVGAGAVAGGVGGGLATSSVW